MADCPFITRYMSSALAGRKYRRHRRRILKAIASISTCTRIQNEVDTMDEYLHPGDPIAWTPVEMKLIPRPIEEFRALCDLTLELTRLRQDECKHLCIENVGPE